MIGVLALLIIVPLYNFYNYPVAGQQQSHSIAGGTYPINAAEYQSIPFTIPDGVNNAFVSGQVLITGGILSTIEFSIINADTGQSVMSQTYTDQGNIGVYLPAGNYKVVLQNNSVLAGEIHTVTLTLNAYY